MPYKRWFMGHYFGFDLPFFALKNQFVLSSFFDTFVDSKGLVEFVPSILTSFFAP
jgi:hypothetical protein